MIEKRDKDNFITVLAPMEDTPGFKAGILAGDRIIKIDGSNRTDRMGITEAVQHLRGEAGTMISTLYHPCGLRPSRSENLKLTRAIIKVDMVKGRQQQEGNFLWGPDKIGYVHLIQFGEKTSDEL